MTSIVCEKGHKHTSVAEVKSCHLSSAPVVTEGKNLEAPATEKQIAFLKSLADQKLPKADANIVKAAATSGHWGRRSISTEINRLRELPKHPQETGQESPRDGQTPVDLESGMYRLGETFYKVQVAVHGSGKPYAKRLVPQDLCKDCGHEESQTEHLDHEFQPTWQFQYAPGAIKELRPEHKLSLEQAKEFGALYGTCCCCGRTLTNEESIENGIGSICAGKYFG